MEVSTLGVVAVEASEEAREELEAVGLQGRNQEARDNRMGGWKIQDPKMLSAQRGRRGKGVITKGISSWADKQACHGTMQVRDVRNQVVNEFSTLRFANRANTAAPETVVEP